MYLPAAQPFSWPPSSLLPLSDPNVAAPSPLARSSTASSPTLTCARASMTRPRRRTAARWRSSEGASLLCASQV